MAHRQSGSYKEEPGVAVAVPGDHVSFAPLPFMFCSLLESLCRVRIPFHRYFRIASSYSPLLLVRAARADGKLPCTGSRGSYGL